MFVCLFVSLVQVFLEHSIFMQSSCNLHAVFKQSSCHLHAIFIQPACNLSAVSYQSFSSHTVGVQNTLSCFCLMNIKHLTLDTTGHCTWSQSLDWSEVTASSPEEPSHCLCAALQGCKISANMSFATTFSEDIQFLLHPLTNYKDQASSWCECITGNNFCNYWPRYLHCLPFPVFVLVLCLYFDSYLLWIPINKKYEIANNA